MSHHAGGQNPALEPAAARHLAPVPSRRIYMGEVVASATPLLVQTLLGSCVAACLRDPDTGIGGMNHILLPGSDSATGEDRTSRRGVHAMELLINAIIQAGGDPRRLVAKVFGGGNVVASLHSPTVGELNAQFIRSFLATEKIPLVAERLGGKQAVQVHFRTDTGKATVRSLDGARLLSIQTAKDQYRSSFREAGVEGDVTLF